MNGGETRTTIAVFNKTLKISIKGKTYTISFINEEGPQKILKYLVKALESSSSADEVFSYEIIIRLIKDWEVWSINKFNVMSLKKIVKGRAKRTKKS